MIKLKQLLNEDTEPIIGYHVTFKHLLSKIEKEGLIPQTPKDMDDLEAVYLFKTRGDVENALSNWLGERIDDMEEELGKKLHDVTLKINIKGLQLVDTVGYEWACVERIDPKRILEILDI